MYIIVSDRMMHFFGNVDLTLNGLNYQKKTKVFWFYIVNNQDT